MSYTGYQLYFAKIDASTSGDTELVAAVDGKRIKVCSYVLVVSGNVTVKFRTGSDDITGGMACVQYGGVASPVGSPKIGPLFQTEVGEALNINLSASVSVGGHLSYYLEG